MAQKMKSGKRPPQNRPNRPNRPGAPNRPNGKRPVQKNVGNKNRVNTKKAGSSKKNNKKRKKSGTLQEKLIIAAAVILGILIIAILVLNIPFMTGPNGQSMSVLEWFKSQTPMAEKEGYLSKDTTSYELTSQAEVIDDKRDFTNDQIIEGQFTVLCLGFDESRQNSDVMMLFQFDIAADKINVLQIPRDSYVPEYTSSSNGKINSVYSQGDQDLIPIQRTVDAVRDTFGIPIDRYVTTGCEDIVDMVDLVGGIPINLPEKVIYSYDKVLYPGEQVLNGEQAELFVRARKGYYEGDIGRVKAQRIFMAAAMQKFIDMGTVEATNFLSEIYEKEYIATDMSLKELSILADFAGDMDLDDVTVQMVPGEAVDDYNGYSVWSIHKDATIDVLNEYFRPYQTELGYDDLPITEIVESDFHSTDIYDQNQDNLQDIADGAKPGESKKPKEPEYDYDEDDDYGY